MKIELSNEELMDVIMSYDRYIQDYSSSYDMVQTRPLTVAQFYDELYNFYSFNVKPKCVC